MVYRLHEVRETSQCACSVPRVLDALAAEPETSMILRCVATVCVCDSRPRTLRVPHAVLRCTVSQWAACKRERACKREH
eukprot:15437530-Alexandrium_andersonii.AAC.1